MEEAPRAKDLSPRARERGTYVVKTGQPLGLARTVAGFREDGWGVDGDSRNAHPPGDVRAGQKNDTTTREGDNVLLNNLKPDGELDPACDVQTAVVETKEHGDVRVALGMLLLERDVRHDVVVLALCLGRLDAAVLGAQATKYLARFVQPSHLDQPTGRLCGN